MKRRGSFTLGFLLILIGGWFLAVQFVPEIKVWMDGIFDWPMWILFPGLIFLLASIISGVTELAIPGSIISSVGLILYYQNATGDWQSWSYAWAFIIMGVGIGVFLSHIFRGRVKTAFQEGGPPFMTGLVLFLIFGSIFRAFFGQSPLLGEYWPIVLIVVGLWMLVRSLFFRRRTPKVTVTTTVTTDQPAAVETAESIEDWEKELEAAFEGTDVEEALEESEVEAEAAESEETDEA